MAGSARAARDAIGSGVTRIAIIGGTGHYAGAGLAAGAGDGDDDAPLDRIRIESQDVLFLPRHGRNHERLPHEIDYRAQMSLLEGAGVQAIIALNAVGGITVATQTPGTLVVPHQLIDYTWGRESVLRPEAEPLSQHVDFTQPFDKRIQRALLVSGESVVDGAVYGVTQGPRLETAAEIDRLERDGCDIVGMTAMPEAVLARQAGIAYAVLATVVNAAAGRGGATVDVEEIARVQASARTRVARVVAAAVAALSEG